MIKGVRMDSAAFFLLPSHFETKKSFFLCLNVSPLFLHGQLAQLRISQKTIKTKCLLPVMYIL